tara:strand:- start:805 stop:1185 length:381 start_codon:yes stop_codon:yes gene_type:complete
MTLNNNRRRSFRGRHQKNNFRRRNTSSNHNNGHYTSSVGNRNFNRNGSMSNPANVEKTILKFQQLAKDAQSSGDPVLCENYLQHADHFSRKLAEINSKNSLNEKTPIVEEKVDTSENKFIEEKTSD